jgi:hypothetical protein
VKYDVKTFPLILEGTGSVALPLTEEPDGLIFRIEYLRTLYFRNELVGDDTTFRLQLFLYGLMLNNEANLVAEFFLT